MKKTTIIHLNGRQVVVADPEQVKAAMKPATAPKAGKKSGKAAGQNDGEKVSNAQKAKDLIFAIAAVKYPKILPYFTAKNPDYRVAAKYLGPEDILHIAICAFIREYHPALRVSHAKNEGKEGHVGQAKKRMMGVMAGFADLMIQKPGTLHALFLEVKVKPNVLTPEQKEFLEFQKKCGHFAFPVYSFGEAADLINDYAKYLDFNI